MLPKRRDRAAPRRTTRSFEQAVYPPLVAQGELAAYVTDHRYYSVGSHERLPLTDAFLARRPAVILDRDGVLNAAPAAGGVRAHARRTSHWLPGALEALRCFAETGYRVIVVSNQAGVGRGAMTMADLEAVHARLRGGRRGRPAAGSTRSTTARTAGTRAATAASRKPGMLFSGPAGLRPRPDAAPRSSAMTSATGRRPRRRAAPFVLRYRGVIPCSTRSQDSDSTATGGADMTREGVLITGHNGYIGSVMASASRRGRARGRRASTPATSASCTPGRRTAATSRRSRKDIRDLEARRPRGLRRRRAPGGAEQRPDRQPQRRAGPRRSTLEASVRLAELARRPASSGSCSPRPASCTACRRRRWSTRTSPLDPQTEYARSKVEAERAHRGAGRRRVLADFLRNGTVYGLSPRMRFDTVLQRPRGRRR